MTFGPFIAHRVAPVIARNTPDVPVLNYLRGNTGYPGASRTARRPRPAAAPPGRRTRRSAGRPS
jgi:hypothetical protein